MQKLIIRGGMLTARGKTFQPLVRLQDFLESIEWPASVSRVPSKVFKLGSRAQIDLGRSSDVIFR